MLQSHVTIILIAIATLKAEEQQVLFKIEETSFQHGGFSIWEGVVDSLTSCSLTCARQPGCNSANFVQSQGTCSLFKQKQTQQYTKRVLQQQGTFYLEKVEILVESSVLCPPIYVLEIIYFILKKKIIMKNYYHCYYYIIILILLIIIIIIINTTHHVN